MLGSLLRHDLRLLSRERSALIVLALTLACVGYAIDSGSRWKARQQAEIAAARAELASAAESELESLRDLERGVIDIAAAPAAGLPNTVRTELLLPPGPLAELAVGDADLRPGKASITAVGRADDMFRFYQVENPALLALGRFDLAFVVVYLLPLLILGMTYSVLSADRESGALGLLLAQPLTAAQVAWARIGLRTGLLVATAVIGGMLAWLWIAPRPLADQALPRLALWVLVVTAYCAFWACLAGFVAARNRGSDANALILLLAWAVITLLLPSSVTLVAQTLSPTPSRLEYVTASRAAENAANAQGRELLQGYLLDHPELEATQQSAVAPFIKTFVLVQQRVEAAVAPVTERFEQRLAQQQRIAGGLAYLSPASLTLGLLSELAGTSFARQQRFEAEAAELRRAWLAQLEGPIIAGRRLTAGEFSALPRPAFEETPLAPVARASVLPIIVLLLYSGLALWSARRRFTHFSPASSL